MCVFCKTKHSFTLYLYILYLSLVPYRSTDSQSLCQNANTGNHTLVSCTKFLRKIPIGFLYFNETIASQIVFLVRSKHSFTLYLFLVFNRSTLQSRSFLKNNKSFLCKYKIVNNRSILSTHADRKIAVPFSKHSFTPYLSLSSH
jgi:hypothetical protein